MIAATLIILAAICKAVADTLAHHFDTSIFKKKRQRFWNPAVSSNEAPRIFAYKIDAWHLFNSGMIIFLVSAVPLHQFDKWHLQWYWEILIGGTLWNIIFNTFYNKILR